MTELSKGESMLLSNLHFNGGQMQAKELADIAGISTARVSALLNAEEEKGYIRRDTIQGDRRKVNVILTQAGEKEFRKRDSELKSRISAYFEFLGEADSKALLRIMEHTREFMEK
jgi:DNA-binding MarR family transcriptional regulator